MKSLFYLAIIFLMMVLSSAVFIDEFYQVNRASTISETKAKKLNCRLLDGWQCVVCNSGYFVDGGDCSKKIDNCDQQIQANYCEKCVSGFSPKYESNSRKITGCLNTVTNCRIYNAYGDCFLCNDGFYLRQNVCTSTTDDKRLSCSEFDYADQCIRPHQQFAFDSKYNLIDNKRTNCRVYNEGGSCIGCHHGYQLSSQLCKKVIDDKYLPHNWLYVSLSTFILNNLDLKSTQNSCYNMNGKVPTYVEIIEADKVIFKGCFKDFNKGGYDSDNCDSKGYAYVNNKVVCACSTATNRFVLSQASPKCIAVDDTTKYTQKCKYYNSEMICLECDDGYSLYQSASGIECKKTNTYKQCRQDTEYFDSILNSCQPNDPNEVNCFQFVEGICALCDVKYYLKLDKTCGKHPDPSLCRSKEYNLENEIGCSKCSIGQYLDANKVCQDATGASGNCNNEKYQVWNDNACVSQPNCSSLVLYDNSVLTCKRCEPGYFLYQDTANKKQECTVDIAKGHIKECYIYSEDYKKCTICNDGYFLTNNLCKLEILNCQTYSADYATCLTCNEFYKLVNNECTSIVKTDLTNCLEWDVNYLCTKCNSLNQVQNGKCVIIDDAYKTNECQKVYNSLKDNTCIKQIYLYGNYYNKSCTIDAAPDDFCFAEECDTLLYGKQNASCVNSIGKVPYCSTYILDSTTKLQSCTECHPSYLITDDKTKCLKAIANCLTLTNDSNIFIQSCSACQKGFDISADKKTCSQVKTDANSSLNISAKISILALLIISFIY